MNQTLNPFDVALPESDDEQAPAAEPPIKAVGYGPVRQKDLVLPGTSIVFQPVEVDDVVVGMEEDEEALANKEPYTKPNFPALNVEQQAGRRQFRRIMVPTNRMGPLKNNWVNLIQPIVEHMKLDVRMNVKKKCVEIRTNAHTQEISSLQKSADYMKAFMCGFEQADAIALLRLDDLFIQSFQIKDVKRLHNEHLTRCIGRIAGKDGKTKYAIENATRTRIAMQKDHIHILGSFSNIRLARTSVCNLILGSEPGKVYSKLRTVSKRVMERI